MNKCLFTTLFRTPKVIGNFGKKSPSLGSGRSHLFGPLPGGLLPYTVAHTTTERKNKYIHVVCLVNSTILESVTVPYGHDEYKAVIN